MKIKFLEYRELNELFKFLKLFNKKKFGLNPNYINKKFFLNFFKINKSKKSKCLIIKKKTIFGFRGNIVKKFQYSYNQKIRITKGVDSLLWFSKADKINNIKLLNVSENLGEVSTSTCYGSTEFYYKHKNYNIFDLERYYIPLNLEKFNKIKLSKIKINKIKSFGNYILEPKQIDSKILENIWIKISKKINIFSQYRDKNFWSWRYANCQYFNYLYWECPNQSGSIIARIEKVLDKKFINKEYFVLRIIEILPLSKVVWKNGKSLKFQNFLISVLKWSKNNGIFAADFYISKSIFNRTLLNVGFKKENKVKVLPIIFNKIDNRNRKINIAYKNHIIKKKEEVKYLPYFVKSDGGGDFPPSFMTKKDLDILRNINNNAINKKNF